MHPTLYLDRRGDLGLSSPDHRPPAGDPPPMPQCFHARSARLRTSIAFRVCQSADLLLLDDRFVYRTDPSGSCLSLPQISSVRGPDAICRLAPCG